MRNQIETNAGRSRQDQESLYRLTLLVGSGYRDCSAVSIFEYACSQQKLNCLMISLSFQENSIGSGSFSSSVSTTFCRTLLTCLWVWGLVLTLETWHDDGCSLFTAVFLASFSHRWIDLIIFLIFLSSTSFPIISLLMLPQSCSFCSFSLKQWGSSATFCMNFFSTQWSIRYTWQSRLKLLAVQLAFSWINSALISPSIFSLSASSMSPNKANFWLICDWRGRNLLKCTCPSTPSIVSYTLGVSPGFRACSSNSSYCRMPLCWCFLRSAWASLFLICCLTGWYKFWLLVESWMPLIFLRAAMDLLRQCLMRPLQLTRFMRLRQSCFIAWEVSGRFISSRRLVIILRWFSGWSSASLRVLVTLQKRASDSGGSESRVVLWLRERGFLRAFLSIDIRYRTDGMGSPQKQSLFLDEAPHHRHEVLLINLNNILFTSFFLFSLNSFSSSTQLSSEMLSPSFCLISCADRDPFPSSSMQLNAIYRFYSDTVISIFPAETRNSEQSMNPELLVSILAKMAFDMETASFWGILRKRDRPIDSSSGLITPSPFRSSSLKHLAISTSSEGFFMKFTMKTNTPVWMPEVLVSCSLCMLLRNPFMLFSDSELRIDLGVFLLTHSDSSTFSISGRCWGSFCNISVISILASGEMLPQMGFLKWYSPFLTSANTLSSFSPLKGGSPDSRMQRMIPADQTSHLWLQTLSRTSGATQYD